MESAECLLQERFQKLGLFPKAFSSLQYCGTRTYNPPTDFSGLLRSLEHLLDNNSTRSPRSAGVIYKALQVCLSAVLWCQPACSLLSDRPSLLQALSQRFSGEIPDEQSGANSFFPEEYFTCCCVCLSCGYDQHRTTNRIILTVYKELQSKMNYQPQSFILLKHLKTFESK